jgi:DUF4097 and DUF4098 domain-containing protein YvlB
MTPIPRPRSLSGRLRGPVVVAATLAILLLTGCTGGTFGMVRASDTLDRSLDVPAGTPVRVETFNGAIDVATADGTRVSALVTRTGEGRTMSAAEADRDKIEVTFDLVDGVAVLRAVYGPSPDSVSGSRGAAVSLRVPAATPLELVSSNGAVGVHDTAGPVTVRTSNGAVDLRGVAGMLSVETSNGAVTLAAERASVDARTSNGALSFAGALEPGTHRLETSNGRVDLRLPADASFTIDATTSNGSVDNEFALAGSTTKDAVRGTVGGESASAVTITARTSNGALALHKR